MGTSGTTCVNPAEDTLPGMNWARELQQMARRPKTTIEPTFFFIKVQGLLYVFLRLWCLGIVYGSLSSQLQVFFQNFLTAFGVRTAFFCNPMKMGRPIGID